MNQKLRVGDVVTAVTVGTLNPNTTGSPAGTANTPGYDPSLNYTIVSFDPLKRTVELSLPVKVKTATMDTFTFNSPQYVVRSSDAPAAAPTGDHQHRHYQRAALHHNHRKYGRTRERRHAGHDQRRDRSDD